MLAIIGILSSVGVPSYNKFVEQGRFSQATNDLYNAYRFARSEAIKTSSPMTLKPKTVSDWSDGWEVVNSGNDILLEVKKPHASIEVSGAEITVFGRGSINIAGFTFLTVSSASRTSSICVLESGQSKKGACI
uniref:GspH/FimT family pseudopilin n=1 Tax=Psychromonas sp. Urea-02u-13 TaxID=2058326 RepID=UPI001E398C9E|nr:GspH/FimT family protein [Psychromonas sp. Urea-02u-13]